MVDGVVPLEHDEGLRVVVQPARSVRLDVVDGNAMHLGHAHELARPQIVDGAIHATADGKPHAKPCEAAHAG